MLGAGREISKGKRVGSVLFGAAGLFASPKFALPGVKTYGLTGIRKNLAKTARVPSPSALIAVAFSPEFQVGLWEVVKDSGIVNALPVLGI